jgi:hypothetical protein
MNVLMITMERWKETRKSSMSIGRRLSDGRAADVELILITGAITMVVEESRVLATFADKLDFQS